MSYAAAGAAAGTALGPVGTAVGGIAGGIADFLGAQSANNMNWDQFVSNQMWNTTQISAARDYDYMMSNSAYQRARQDMEKAGLNPMLMMNQGGAGGGNSPITNAGVGNAAQNPAAGLGRGIASAGQVVSMLNDLKTADAQRTLLGAQAAQAGATAQREASSAKLNDWQTAVVQATMGATKAKAKTEEMAGPIDQQYMSTKKLLEIIAQGAGIAKDASFSVEAIMNMIPALKGMKKIQGLGPILDKIKR